MMSEIIKPGAGILFMKVGTHAREKLEDIIRRKSREIEETGYGMWGYGGNTCHPSSMVQPFAKSLEERGQTIHLIMEKMNSNYFAEPLSAAEFSVDGRNWQPIPDTIDVRGSRYALMIKDLHEANFELPLNATRVPVGPSTGRIGSRYIKGKVDKACLEVLDESEGSDDVPIQRPISLIAELISPYAVFLRE